MKDHNKTKQQLIQELIAMRERINELEMSASRSGNVDEELERRRKDIEELAKKRTHDLRTINEQLLREVMDRRQAEEALRVSEERFRSLVERTSDWVWETDSQGVFC